MDNCITASVCGFIVGVVFAATPITTKDTTSMKVASLEAKVDRLEARLSSTKEVIYVSDVTATVYNALGYQTDDTPNITADGTRVDPFSPDNIVALSRDLLREYGGGPFTFGDTIYVKHPDRTGIYEVHDSMHWRWQKRIDFLEAPDGEFFKLHNMKLYKVGE